MLYMHVAAKTYKHSVQGYQHNREINKIQVLCSAEIAYLKQTHVWFLACVISGILPRC